MMFLKFTESRVELLRAAGYCQTVLIHTEMSRRVLEGGEKDFLNTYEKESAVQSVN